MERDSTSASAVPMMPALASCTSLTFTVALVTMASGSVSANSAASSRPAALAIHLLANMRRLRPLGAPGCAASAAPEGRGEQPACGRHGGCGEAGGARLRRAPGFLGEEGGARKPSEDSHLNPETWLFPVPRSRPRRVSP